MEDIDFSSSFQKRNYTQVICYPASQVSSIGIWFGHNILHYSLPRTLLQMASTIVVSRTVQVLLQHLCQPTVVSDLIGGIMLGPTVLGNFPTVQLAIFPDRGIFLARVLLWVGAIYHMFSVGVKTNFTFLAHGHKAMIVAAVGLVLPIVSVMGLYLLIGQPAIPHISKSPFWALMAVHLGCTPLAVIQRLLSDFQLLNTEVGRLSLTVGMLNDVVGVVALLLMDISEPESWNLTGLLIQTGTLLILVLFSVFVIRPLCFWLIRRTPEGKRVQEGYVLAFLLAALNSGICCNFIGLSVLEGPLILGLVIPSGPPLGATLLEKIETINKNFLLPMFFAAIGQRLNIFTIHDWVGLWVIVFLATASRLLKMLGTIVSALSCKIPFRQALPVGLIISTRGLIDTMPYFVWETRGLTDAQTYVAFVLVGLGVTMISSPIIWFVSLRSRTYKPHVRRTIQHSRPHTELRLLSCVHDPDSIPSILNIVELTNATPDNPVCLYVMHLVELVGRATPMLIAHLPHKKSAAGSSIFSAFHSYERQHEGSIAVQPFTSIAPHKTAHDDICSVALHKKVSLIILPFQKQQLVPGSSYVVDNALQIINPSVLNWAPCSVAILVNRSGLSTGTVGLGDPSSIVYRVGMLFFGGPDDREALAYAARMAEHPSVVLVVIRFLATDLSMETMEEKPLDDELVGDFRVRCVDDVKICYHETLVHDGEEAVRALCAINNSYDLMVVGRNQWFDLDLAEGLSLWRENTELGAIGDMCTHPEFFGGKASVLVMQQQARAAADVEVRLTQPKHADLLMGSMFSKPNQA